jgi:mRNA interferase RelE/StbE
VGRYRHFIKPSAVKEIESLPKRDRPRVVQRIQRLSIEPRPPASEKLSGEEKYRVRQGQFRIVYAIDDAARTVLVVKVGHRRDIYR